MPVKFLKTYHRVLDWIKAFSHVAFVIRFSIAMSLLAGIALRLADQSLEALRVLAAHDSAQFWPRVFFIIAALILSLLSWYCARVLLYLIDPLPKAEGEVERAKKFWIRHLPRIFGAVPLLFTAWALWAAAKWDAVEKNYGLLKTLAVACLVATFFLYSFFHFRRWLSARLKGRKPGTVADRALDEGAILPGVSNLAKSGKIVLIFSLFLWVCLLLFFTFEFGRHTVVEMAILFGPLAILLLFAAIWIPVGSALVYAGNLTRLPLFLILLVCAFSFSAADCNDNHLVRYKSVAGQTKPMDINEGFKKWLEGRCDKNNYKNSDGKSEYPVFIVSAEGGGLRAAYFASLILTKLQDENPAFAHHVFGISGVSGGSLGGAVFAALADKYVKQDGADPCNFQVSLPDKAQGKMRILNDQILGDDILSPILASLLFPDLLQRFLFFPVQRFDRSRAAEDALGYYWKQATGGEEFYKNFHLYDLYQDRATHQSTFAKRSTPALFLNVTRVETGEQLVVSSLNPNGPDEERNKRLNGLKSLADFDPAISLPLSTAAYLSARFPVVASAGYLQLPGGKARFIDGGYFENSGTATVLDLLSAMRLKDVAKDQEINIRLIIIRIGTDPGELQYKKQGLGEITSPIFGLLNTMTARGTLSTLEMRTALAQLGDQNSKGQGNAPGELEKAIAQRIEVSEPNAKFGLRSAEQAHFQVNETASVKLPLGYLLSKEAREYMNQEIESFQQCSPDTDRNYCSFMRVLEVLKKR
ncbi:MAG: hypothetical protein QOH25_283 [Acidobacteriota bacterium]|jgi:hypothetical protein|nr:hypothetical protein [Acidobacteriota bacterium]